MRWGSRAVFNGASTASVSWTASSVFSTSLSSYRTRTTSVIPAISSQSQSPPHTHPTAARLYTAVFHLQRGVTFVGSFFGVFLREPVILSALLLRNRPLSHRQILQTHSGSESKPQHAGTHTHTPAKVTAPEVL